MLTLLAFVTCIITSNAAKSYPYRPTFHFVPDPPDWMNDPNGPFYDPNTQIYHLMFQYKTPRTWGHAISTDLLHWQNLPIAIDNDESYDVGGVFTGSTTLVNGVPISMYSVNTNNRMCIASPADMNDVNLTKWTDYAGNCVLNANSTVPTGRDPTSSWTTDGGKTWTFAYATQGPEKNGAAVTFQTTDWKTWRRMEKPLTYSNTSGGWECPDFFYLPKPEQSDGITHVAKASFGGRDHLAIGGYNAQTTEFVPFNGASHNEAWACDDCIWDFGDFYASKTFYDAKNDRQIIWGWLTEARDCSANPPPGEWCGVQTLPREIKLVSKEDSPTGEPRIVTYPIAEFDSLRIADTKYNTSMTLDGGDIRMFGQSDVYGNTLDIEVQWSNGGDCSVWVLVNGDQSQRVRVGVNFANVNNAKTFYIDTGASVTQQEVAGWNGVDPIKLRIIVDHSVINVFVNDGISVGSKRAYPNYDVFRVGVSQWQHNTNSRCILDEFVSYNVSTAIQPPSRSV